MSFNTVFSNDIQSNSRRVWPLAIPIMTFVFFVAGQLSALAPGRFVFGIQEDELYTYPTILYFLIVTFLMAAVFLSLWVRYMERRTLASIGLSRGTSTPLSYAKGFAYGLASAISAVLIVFFLGGYEVENTVSWSVTTLLPILLLMGAFMIQSGVEELVFRGWMMSRLMERYGLWVGVLGNSLLFMVMHFPSIEDEGALIAIIFALNVFLFSVFLSFYALKAKSVWGIAAWHAAWNWTYITWFGLPTTGIALDLKPLITDLAIAPGTPNWLSGGLVGTENSIMVTVILSVGCVVLLLRRREENALDLKDSN